MIYVHVPFCHRKCVYCAFYSKAVASSQWPVAGYVDALLQEMEARRGEQVHPIRTVYFGGGTPSILPIEQLTRIVEGVHRCFDLSRVEEMTLEANPEDLTPEYLASLRRLGFDRLSIGVQSLDDKVLRMLNRRHTAQQAIEAVENARGAGFENLSVDFIYGIIEGIEPIDKTALLEKVTHISAYALTVEEGTALARQVEQGRVTLPDEDEVVRQYYALHELFTRCGFEQYEVSNYARPGYESKHNSRYWNRTPYMGFGPAAHSFSLFDGGSTSVAHVEKRRWNISSVEKYISGLSGHSGITRIFDEETLTEADAYNELLMTSLRTVAGLPLALVPEGQKERLHRGMQPYVECGWVERLDDRYRPTAEGLLHADGMAAALFVA